MPPAGTLAAKKIASRQTLDNDDDADTRTRPTACRDRRNPWPASIDTGSRFRSESLAGSVGMRKRQSVKAGTGLLHDRESERGNQLINPHAADLCLQDELSDRHLIKG